MKKKLAIGKTDICTIGQSLTPPPNQYSSYGPGHPVPMQQILKCK